MTGPGDHLSRQLVDGLNDVFGVHRGHRAAHAKGLCCAGEFRANAYTSRLTRAAHMAGAVVGVTVRFSNASGDPGAPDAAGLGGGMAVKFHLRDGGSTDLLSNTVPIFPAQTPHDFLELTAALTPDPVSHLPDKKKIDAFARAHPALQNALGLALTAPPLMSYARTAYWAVHAFRFTNAEGQECFVRYSWQPRAGVATLSPKEAERRPANYLQSELRDRFAKGCVEFTLHLQLAAAGDDVNDPATAWPPDRPTVFAGELKLTHLCDQAACEALVFDPTRLTDGIACSADPILNARPGAYGVSHRRRTTP